MIDIKFLRENPDVVKQNIKNKFQNDKLPLVDEVIELDKQARAAQQEADTLRANKNAIAKQIGALMAQGKKEEAEEVKKQVAETSARLKELEALEPELKEKVKKIMMIIPNIIDPSVPIGKDDSENVEVQKYGEPVVPDFEIPYHADIMEALGGIDLDSARKVAGNGFYYLMGDIARLHSAIISYARDFMIDRGFTYCIPPFMIRSNVVTGVMSFAEMDAMMYKIEGEDLYLIGTSEHSMIGKFIDTIIPEDELPKTLTSYSPCFRKEKGAHGIEERGVYRIHQFEKQEISFLKTVIAKAAAWFPYFREMLRIENLCRLVGFDERQTATLVSGKPLEYAGELYSEEHERKFTTEKAGFQVLKDPTDGTGLVLAIDRKPIAEWFKEQFEKLRQNIRRPMQPQRKGKSIKL